ncbi:hypothetical protein SynBIOSU31_02064 [Synechococcus sp. BIOS-U3-1]|uniref:hypothetical protein n=1 Tax=Synechococcus sp. BIOS-U3-1 TaxID=1400865 RepID=UPI001647DD8C|nr:hypothetical protein [Synechococcus sp. BIOS-U3-1]QNI58930.1 hypothetical protein SynBIOSU31_02064 [Synechococcus sp. BIOS-U3-1]
MKWLLSMLGMSGKDREPDQRLAVDGSFLSVTPDSDQLLCEWKIRDESILMIQRDFESALFIRIKDISGDHSMSSKTIQVSLKQVQASIELPSRSGKILVDLGYYCGLTFMTLEYQVLDFGPKIILPAQDADWFAKESPNIHEEMYKLATRGRLLGGSEMIQKL